MQKALFIILATCFGLIATGGVSNAADLVISGKSMRVRHVAHIDPAPQIFSLRRSYPGYRPYRITDASVVVECPSAYDFWDNYRGSDALYCRRQ